MFFHKMREKMKVVVIVVVIAMAGGLLWAGGASWLGGRSKPQEQVQAVIATVNGQGISYYDFQQTFINRLQQIEQEQGVLPGRAYEAVKFDALDSLVGSVLLSQEIVERKISASAEEIEEELQALIDLFPSEEEYKLQLQMVGLSEDMLKASLAEEVKFNKLKEEIIGHIPVSEQEVKEAYERVRASHILIMPKEETDAGWAVAKAESLAIREEVTVENFAELAELYSEDGSSNQGGDIGFVSRGQTVSEFEAAVFDLEVGEISAPIRSMFGYHIIIVKEREEARGEDFEEKRAEIEWAVREEKGQEDLNAWFKELKEEADIVFTDHQMNAVGEIRAGNLENALHYYKLAVEQEPNDGYLYASLGDVYQELGNAKEAIAQYKLAAETFPNDYTILMGLGDLYKENALEDEAVAAYLKASELVPNDLYTQLVLHNNLNNLERYEDAKVIEERIVEFQERQKELLGEKEPAQDEAEELLTEEKSVEEHEVEKEEKAD